MSDKIEAPAKDAKIATPAQSGEKPASPPPKEERIGPPAPAQEPELDDDDDDDGLDDEMPAALRADEKAFSVQILQFFLFPLLLVVTCLAIFFVFGVAGAGESNIDDLLMDIREGGAHARRVAAHELANALIKDYQRAQKTGEPAELLANPNLADTLVDVLKDSNTRDPDFKKFLFMAGSLTHDKRFAPLAIESLEEYYASPEAAENAANDGSYIVNDPEVEVYMALARLADPSTVEPLKKFYAQGGDDTKKLVVHAIGAIESPEAEAFLLDALKNGESVNVTWNAAIRLAARKNPAAKPAVAKLLDPDYVKSAPNIRDKQVVDWLATGAMAAATLGDQSFKEPLEKLAQNPRPVVANAARKALDELANPSAAAAPAPGAPPAP